MSHLPFGPTAYFTLTNPVLRHDIPECTPSSQAYPHLIIDGLNSKVRIRKEGAAVIVMLSTPTLSLNHPPHPMCLLHQDSTILCCAIVCM